MGHLDLPSNCFDARLVFKFIYLIQALPCFQHFLIGFKEEFGQTFISRRKIAGFKPDKFIGIHPPIL